MRVIPESSARQAHRLGLEPFPSVVEVDHGAILHLVPLVHEVSLMQPNHRAFGSFFVCQKLKN